MEVQVSLVIVAILSITSGQVLEIATPQSERIEGMPVTLTVSFAVDPGDPVRIINANAITVGFCNPTANCTSRLLGYRLTQSGGGRNYTIEIIRANRTEDNGIWQIATFLNGTFTFNLSISREAEELTTTTVQTTELRSLTPVTGTPITDNTGVLLISTLSGVATTPTALSTSPTGATTATTEATSTTATTEATCDETWLIVILSLSVVGLIIVIVLLIAIFVTGHNTGKKWPIIIGVSVGGIIVYIVAIGLSAYAVGNKSTIENCGPYQYSCTVFMVIAYILLIIELIVFFKCSDNAMVDRHTSEIPMRNGNSPGDKREKEIHS